MSLEDTITPPIFVDAFKLGVNPQVARITLGDSGGTGRPEDAIERVTVVMPTEALRSMHRTIGQVLAQVDAAASVQEQRPLQAAARH